MIRFDAFTYELCAREKKHTHTRPKRYTHVSKVSLTERNKRRNADCSNHGYYFRVAQQIKNIKKNVPAHCYAKSPS